MSTTAPVMPATQLLTLDEAAEKLHMPRVFLESAVEAGAIGHVKLAEEIRIHPQCLEDFIEAHSVKPWGGRGARATNKSSEVRVEDEPADRVLNPYPYGSMKAAGTI